MAPILSCLLLLHHGRTPRAAPERSTARRRATPEWMTARRNEGRGGPLPCARPPPIGGGGGSQDGGGGTLEEVNDIFI